jgi:putative ABC transport system substrate-binding protein
MGEEAPRTSDPLFPRIGILQFIPQLEDTVWGFMEALENRLGSRPLYETADAEGREKDCLPLARRICGKGCRLLFGCLTPAAKALIDCSSDCAPPVVFAPVFHPALSGLVEDEERPGGRITGVSGRLDPAEKMDAVALLFPALSAITVLADAGEPLSRWEAERLAAACRDRNMEVRLIFVENGFPVPSEEGRVHLLAFSPALEETMDRWMDPFFQARAPVVGSSPRAGFLGAVMSVFADHGDLGRKAGEMAARILQGEDPAQMAVRFPDEAALGFNHYAAGRLGLSIPPALGQRVDIL